MKYGFSFQTKIALNLILSTVTAPFMKDRSVEAYYGLNLIYVDSQGLEGVMNVRNMRVQTLSSRHSWI